MKYLILLFFIIGCSSTPHNYELFREAKPRSILILPPISNSTDVRATYSYLSTVTMPVAEKGFYVFPVAMIDQMMKENGMPSANEMHQASVKKIREIINPDAILYLTLESYGTSYVVVDSQTTVSVSAKLISAITGEVIWQGHASVNDGSGGGDNLTEMVIGGVLKQVINSSIDQAHNLAPQANEELFHSKEHGLLNGPYSSKPDY